MSFLALRRMLVERRSREQRSNLAGILRMELSGSEKSTVGWTVSIYIWLVC
jgi:hypothetical protein